MVTNNHIIRSYLLLPCTFPDNLKSLRSICTTEIDFWYPSNSKKYPNPNPPSSVLTQYMNVTSKKKWHAIYRPSYSQNQAIPYICVCILRISHPYRTTTCKVVGKLNLCIPKLECAQLSTYLKVGMVWISKKQKYCENFTSKIGDRIFNSSA